MKSLLLVKKKKERKKSPLAVCELSLVTGASYLLPGTVQPVDCGSKPTLLSSGIAPQPTHWCGIPHPFRVQSRPVWP